MAEAGAAGSGIAADGVERIRRHCVTHARLYVVSGGAIAVSCAAMWVMLSMHAGAETSTREAEDRRQSAEVRGALDRSEDRMSFIRDQLIELRADVKELMRNAK